jgi:phage gp46-like protein
MTITKPDRFTGDPKIYIGPDGADWKYPGDGGQPVMDAGLENAAFISKYTRPGWWGNDIFPPENQIGSLFEQAAEAPITATSLGNVEQESENALAWMVSTGLAKEIASVATNPRGRATQVVDYIRTPFDTVTELLGIRNGQNWINQKIDPASEK